MEFEALLDKSLEWRVRILRSFPVPTIAMVNGWCFGGAFSIVAGCDIAIAADEAMFGFVRGQLRPFSRWTGEQTDLGDHAPAGSHLLHLDRRSV